MSAFDPRLATDLSGWDRLRRPVWIFDPVSCRGLYANPPAIELWGAADLDELLARDFSALSPTVRIRTGRLAQATADGEAVTERWTFYPGGTPVTVQALISAFPLSDGSAALLFEAEPTDLQEGERRAVEALRHTSSLISLFDPDGAPVFVNPAAFAAYGEGRHFTDRFADDAQGAAILARVIEGDVLAELVHVRTAAGERSHHLDARRVLDPVTGRSSILLSERDVTAQVEAERALAAAQERTEVALAKARFLATVSHELRTPLNSVLGFAGLLAGSALSEVQAEHLNRISQAGERLHVLVDDLIAITESDGAPPAAAATPFEAAVADEPEAGPLNVLYADDHEANRVLVRTLLTSQGHSCDLANDGAEAVQAVLAGAYDLVLMDIQMPVQDGVSAAREIRASSGPQAAVPIVALTANTLADQLRDYAEAGMDDCIAKPLNAVELLTKVAVWGGRSRAESAAEAA